MQVGPARRRPAIPPAAACAPGVHGCTVHAPRVGRRAGWACALPHPAIPPSAAGPRLGGRLFAEGARLHGARSAKGKACRLGLPACARPGPRPHRRRSCPSPAPADLGAVFRAAPGPPDPRIRTVAILSSTGRWKTHGGSSKGRSPSGADIAGRESSGEGVARGHSGKLSVEQALYYGRPEVSQSAGQGAG